MLLLRSSSQLCQSRQPCVVAAVPVLDAGQSVASRGRVKAECLKQQHRQYEDLSWCGILPWNIKRASCEHCLEKKKAEPLTAQKSHQKPPRATRSHSKPQLSHFSKKKRASSLARADTTENARVSFPWTELAIQERSGGDHACLSNQTGDPDECGVNSAFVCVCCGLLLDGISGVAWGLFSLFVF